MEGREPGCLHDVADGVLTGLVPERSSAPSLMACGTQRKVENE
jgi:hypothetical protein